MEYDKQYACTYIQNAAWRSRRKFTKITANRMDLYGPMMDVIRRTGLQARNGHPLLGCVDSITLAQVIEVIEQMS